MRPKSTSKKAMLDLPLMVLAKMIIGMMTAILIIIPIMNLLFVDDFNKEVAKDTMSSLNDFLEFKVDNYGGVDSRSKCLDIFKIEHLSNSQVMNSKFENYVIVITTDFLGLIKYEDFDKLKSEQVSVNDIKITDIIKFDLDQKIELDFYSFSEGFNANKDDVKMIFLVPSIVLESTLITTATGASKSGYYLYYVANDAQNDGKLDLKPSDSSYVDILQYVHLSDNSKELKNLHIGFIRDNVLKFGVIEKHPTDYNPIGSCRYKPKEITTGDSANPLLNLEGTSCNVDININQETVYTFKNKIYWDNHDGIGFKCNSNYDGLPDFCQSFVENHKEFFTSTIERNSENLNLVSSKFMEFIQYFYNRDDLEYEIEGVDLSSGNLEYEIKGCKTSDNVLVQSEFNFLEFFEKIPNQKLINYVIEKKSLTQEELIFFPTDRVFESCIYSELDENLCSYVISFEEGSKKEFIYYIDTQDPNLKGFYRFKNLGYLFYYVDSQSNKYKINLGGRFLPHSSLELSDNNCGFFRWIIPLMDCNYAEMFQIEFKDNIFDDVATPSFSIFADKTQMHISSKIVNGFSMYFKEESEEYPAGDNNEAIKALDGKSYVFDATNINDIVLDQFHRNEDHEFLNFQMEIAGMFFSVTQRLYDDGRVLLTSSELDSKVQKFELPFEELGDNNEYELSFEQFLSFMYNTPDHSSEKLSNLIFNSDGGLNLEALELREEELDSNRKAYVIYVKDRNVPLFYQTEFGETKLLGLQDDKSEDFENGIKKFFGRNSEIFGEIIIPLNTKGNINFEKINFEITLEEFLELGQNSNLN